MKRLGKVLALHRVSGDVGEFSDEALVAACAAGEIAALGALVDRYRPMVRRFVARLAGNDADADDLVQHAFIEVARSAASFGGRSSVKTWIFAIAVNVVRNEARAAGYRRRLASDLADLPAPPVRRPDELLERNEFLREVRAALAALPHELREAFVLCELEQLTCAEAARVAGVREGTIWRRLHDARVRLRSALRGEP